MTDCPLCGGATEARLTTVDRNRGVRVVEDEPFVYRHCRACGSLFLANVPAELGRYYPPSYYPLESVDAEGAPSETEQAKLALLQRFAAAGQLIEVGPGAGGFAAAAKRAGYTVTAVEMDDRASRHLREGFGIEVVVSDRPEDALGTLPASRAIVLWHVLEHLADPWGLVEAAAANLEPGGVLILAVPNPRAFQLRVLGHRWVHIDAPRHRFLIPAQTLLERGVAAGLRPVALITSDRTGRDWNVFGWQHVVLRAHSRELHRRLAFYAGALTALALSPIERRGLRGSTYTAVLRKDGPT